MAIFNSYVSHYQRVYESIKVLASEAKKALFPAGVSPSLRQPSRGVQSLSSMDITVVLLQVPNIAKWKITIVNG